MDIVNKLRYQARQYTSGSIARGGNPGKHFLDEAADEISRLRAELAAKTAECEGLRKDAERYRWLRQSGEEYGHLPIFNNKGILVAEFLDGAIDAAIKESACGKQSHVKPSGEVVLCEMPKGSECPDCRGIRGETIGAGD